MPLLEKHKLLLPDKRSDLLRAGSTFAHIALGLHKDGIVNKFTREELRESIEETLTDKADLLVALHFMMRDVTLELGRQNSVALDLRVSAHSEHARQSDYYFRQVFRAVFGAVSDIETLRGMDQDVVRALATGINKGLQAVECPERCEKELSEHFDDFEFSHSGRQLFGDVLEQLKRRNVFSL